ALRTGEPRRDARPEREAAEDRARIRIARALERERGARVLDFAGAAIVRALALPRPAKVETQHRAPQLEECRRHAMHHLVVERAAVERMRVADHGEPRVVV